MISQNFKVKLHYPHKNTNYHFDLPNTFEFLKLNNFILHNIKLDIKDLDYTIKWIDDYGDYCIISSKSEFEEAKRTYRLKNMKYVFLILFKGRPLKIGGICNEEKHFIPSLAKRSKAIYFFKSHKYVIRRANLIKKCQVCNKIPWTIRNPCVVCLNCGIILHRDCYRKNFQECTEAEERSKFDEMHGNNDYDSQIESSLNSSTFANEYDCLNRVEIPALGDFKFHKLIGRGSYSKVILVYSKKDKKPYALKVIKKNIIDGEERRWVYEEKNVLLLASGNPFLVHLHSCFQTESRLFFVLEFIMGGDFMFHMQKKRFLNEAEARFYITEISCALNYLHSICYVYRDLKLDNIVINNDGHIKITDFGMCKGNVHLYSQAHTFCGTPNYIAPEILDNENYGYSVDWWALGILIFEMIAGRSPYDNALTNQNSGLQIEEYLFKMIREDEIRIPRNFSVRATDLVKRLLIKNPRNRLGCKKNIEFDELKNHPFFKGIYWDDVPLKKLRPPYIPRVSNHSEDCNFDPIFTSEPIVMTPDDLLSLEKSTSDFYENFDMINENF